MGCGRSSVPAVGEPKIREPLPAEPEEKPPTPQPHKPTSVQNQEAPGLPPQFAAGGSAPSNVAGGGRSASSDVPQTRSSDKQGDIEGGDDADDLGWMAVAVEAAAHADDAPPAWAVSAASGADPSSSSGVGPSPAKEGAEPSLDVKVQILLEGGWRDSSAEETLQICQHIAKREKEFQIKARGQIYIITIDDKDGLSWQMNTKSNKRRQMRVMDSDTSAGPEPDEGLVRSSSSGSSAILSPEVLQQKEWGPQSKRGGASSHPLSMLKDNPHAQECFAMFQANELKLCGEWAVFYHSYSFAALIYEVHAAVGAVLFRFRSKYASLPRILVHEFNNLFGAAGADNKMGQTLMNLFDSKYAANKRDHHPEFRAVGLSVMCSLVATGPEACPPAVFIAGYSCKDLSFRGVLENILESCYVPKAKVKKLADEIIRLSEEHGLDVSQFGGKPCKSGMAGHLMQIFMKRDLVDTLCYPAKPYGPVDTERLPLSKWINGNGSVQVGQARIIAHPKYFMQANKIRCFVASSDQTFHGNREKFQEKLTGLLNVILGEPALRLKAATGIYGGKLPAWWSDEDQREKTRTSSTAAPK